MAKVLSLASELDGRLAFGEISAKELGIEEDERCPRYGFSSGPAERLINYSSPEDICSLTELIELAEKLLGEGWEVEKLFMHPALVDLREILGSFSLEEAFDLVELCKSEQFD
jgi:hypothetical protein